MVTWQSKREIHFRVICQEMCRKFFSFWVINQDILCIRWKKGFYCLICKLQKISFFFQTHSFSLLLASLDTNWPLDRLEQYDTLSTAACSSFLPLSVVMFKRWFGYAFLYWIFSNISVRCSSYVSLPETAARSELSVDCVLTCKVFLVSDRMNICHANVGSFVPKVDELKDTFCGTNLHVIVCYESLLKSHHTTWFMAFPGFYLLRSDRPTG